MINPSYYDAGQAVKFIENIHKQVLTQALQSPGADTHPAFQQFFKKEETNEYKDLPNQENSPE